MVEILETLEDQEIDCMECNKTAHFRSFILRDSRPYKLITVKQCDNCETTETTQDDYEVLDYEIKISCDFTNNVEENLRRMAFINNRALITIIKDDEIIFDFTYDTCQVDCIQGLIMKGEEVYNMVKGTDENLDRIVRGHQIILDIIHGSPFKMIIDDKTGFSRVCAFGVEYSDIQDIEVEDLKDDSVIYEKLMKNNL